MRIIFTIAFVAIAGGLLSAGTIFLLRRMLGDVVSGSILKDRFGKPSDSDSVTPIGGYIFCLVLMTLVVIVTGWAFPSRWTIPVFTSGTLFVGGVYLGMLEEVRAPQEALYLRFGKVIGVLKPGIYPIVSHLWSVALASKSQQTTDLGKQSMYCKPTTGYTGAFSEIIVAVQVVWKITGLQKAYEAYELDVGRIAERIGKATMEAVRTVVGASTPTELMEDRNTVERKIHTLLDELFRDIGIEIVDVDIYDTDEKVLSQAAEIEALAHARGKEAEALAGPLKGNPEAAKVQAANAFADAKVRVAEAYAGAARDVFGPRKKEKSKKGEETDEDSSALIDKIKKFAAGLK